jgi:hypothetical protein
MRTSGRVVVSWGLGLALAGCSDGADPPDAWMPGTGEASSTSGGEEPGNGSVDTGDGQDPSTTDDGESDTDGTGGTDGTDGTDDGVTETGDDPPPTVEPLPQAFQLPFVCGQPWRLDSWGHAPALDMVREPDQVGTEGATLLAPAPGVVNMSYYHDNAGNLVQIDHGEGWFTTYIHMESRSVEVGDVLERGDEIGAVGRTGPTSNDHPHLHFELGVDADGDGEASWGFEGAERVNPWFDGVEYGQSNGLTWRDIASNNCP